MAWYRFSKAVVVVLLYLVLVVSAVDAQMAIPAECGDIIQSELTTASNEANYIVNLNAGDRLIIQFDIFGETLGLDFLLMGNGLNIFGDRVNYRGEQTQFTSPQLSSSGDYQLRVTGTNRGIGSYTLYISCQRHDGSFVDAQGGLNPPNPPTASAPTFSGVGFPGLAPVDFSGTTIPKLPAGTPLEGVIEPAGNPVLGYKIDASAGDTLDISFSRASGNLNLGLVVLSADNQLIFFQMSPGTSQTLNTRFTLPAAGTYTIGVFRVDLLPPAAPEATAFQVTATLNP